ncbi:MAG: diguanylate cyclase [Actinomycetota bacterium]
MTVVKAPADYVRELNSFPDLVLLVDGPTMEVIDVNEHAAREMGWSPSDIIGRPLSDFGDQTATALNETLISRALEGHTVRFDRRVRSAWGEWRNYNFAARIIEDEGKSRFLLVGREMEALAHSHSQLADLLKLADLSEDIFVVCDSYGIVTYANAAAARYHGDQNFVGRQLADFIHDDDTGFARILEQLGANDGRADGRVMAKRSDGSPLMLDVRTVYDEASDRYFTVERDISGVMEQEAEMAKLHEELRRQAKTDELTGVANRTALNEVLEEATQRAQPFSLLLLDMDDFKSVNDSMGHAAGDEFLRCVAQRMKHAVRDGDTVARLGGDEFVVFLPESCTDRASEIAARMLESVGQHYSIGGECITRSCSIGIACFEPGDDASAVLRKADRAAYRAKHEGRNRFVRY